MATARASAILAIDTSPFGQSLKLLPAAKAIRAGLPGGLLACAACTGTCELLATARLADQTIDLGVIKPSNRGFPSAMRNLFRVLKGSRRQEFDVVLDFSPEVETQLASKMIAASRAIAPLKPPVLIDFLLGRGRRNPKEKGDRYRSVLTQLGIAAGDLTVTADLPAEEDARFEQLLAKSGFGGGEPVVVLYASDPKGPKGRGWALENFGALASRLVGEMGVRVVAVDVPHDRGFSDEASGLLPRGSVLLKSPRAVEVVAAFARASLAVTDDPGLAQLALGLGTPAVEVTGQSALESAYAAACETLQKSRTAALFRRP